MNIWKLSTIDATSAIVATICSAPFAYKSVLSALRRPDSSMTKSKFWRGIAYLGMRNATGTILKPTVFLFTSTYSPRISAALPLLTPLLVHPFDTLYVRSVITQFDDQNSLWSGAFTRLALHLTYLVISMKIHPPLQEYVFDSWFQAEPSPLAQLMVISAISLVPLVVTQPLEVVKTKMQADASYRGFWDCIVRIVREEGVMHLWAGAHFRSAAFVTYFCVSTGFKGWLANRLE